MNLLATITPMSQVTLTHFLITSVVLFVIGLVGFLTRRNMIVMFLCTVANYTYGFAYRLGLDASVEMEAILTGILSIGALPPPPTPTAPVPTRPWGQALSREGLYGPDHQHFFVAR